jgi:hypothetical protein
MLPQFGTASRKNFSKGIDGSDEAVHPDKASLDAAWLVLEAANDLGDNAAVEACRRIIDAELKGATALRSDLDLVLHYFR